MKKPLWLIMGLVLGLTACNKTIIEEPKEHKPFPTFPTKEDIAFEAPHGTVFVADSATTYTNCQLEYVPLEIQPAYVNGVSIQFEGYTYGGLKDKTVEAIVKQKILDKMNSFRKYADIDYYSSLPGFLDHYNFKTPLIKTVTVYASSSFCVNNLLSIQFLASVRINDNNYDFIVQEGLNIDLNTGNDVTLSDLFINDSDYESRLNEEVLLKAQNRTDYDPYIYEQNPDSFCYLGGFEGIRGDIGFFLTYDMNIVLVFDNKYPEFFNNYGTTLISIPMVDQKDTIALGQRFIHSSTSLFTDPTTYTINNYLYESLHEFTIHYERINGIRVRESISYPKAMPEAMKMLMDSLLQATKNKVSEITDPSITAVSLEYSAYPMDEYLNSEGLLIINGEVTPLRGTYRADGSKLMLEDLFVDGFDYRTFLKGEIQKYITNSYYEETYDLDEVLDTLSASFQLSCSEGKCYLNFTNEFIWDFAQDEGDFTITVIMNDHPEMFKSSPW